MNRRNKTRGPRASRPIQAILAAARAEAELAHHGYVGAEHVLVALTRPVAPGTAQLLADHGIGTERARDAVRLVIDSGRGDGPRFGPATLLASLGIDLDQIRRQIEGQFGPNAIHNLYASPAGWNLRPRGPLCDLGLSPQLKSVIHDALGRCWDTSPPQLPERLLLHTLDVASQAVGYVLDELQTPIEPLRATLTARLRIAS
jgi:hypothetical protein